MGLFREGLATVTITSPPQLSGPCCRPREPAREMEKRVCVYVGGGGGCAQ